MNFVICIALFAVNVALYQAFGFWWNLMAAVFIGLGTVVYAGLVSHEVLR